MPKYEKVNNHTIRIIIEKAEEVPITRLIKNLKDLEQERDRINKVIDNINDILHKAIELKITPEPKDKKVNKK